MSLVLLLFHRQNGSRLLLLPQTVIVLFDPLPVLVEQSNEAIRHETRQLLTRLGHLVDPVLALVQTLHQRHIPQHLRVLHDLERLGKLQFILLGVGAHAAFHFAAIIAGDEEERHVDVLALVTVQVGRDHGVGDLRPFCIGQGQVLQKNEEI